MKVFFCFSSRRRHTRWPRDWSSDVCSSDLPPQPRSARLGRRPSDRGRRRLWVVGNVALLGGHRAIGLMATHGNPLETVGSIHFSIDIIDDAFELAAFALIGVGMLAFAGLPMRAAAACLAWGQYTMVIGL